MLPHCFSLPLQNIFLFCCLIMPASLYLLTLRLCYLHYNHHLLVESFWFLKDTLDYVPCHKTASHLILNDFNTPKDKIFSLSGFLLWTPLHQRCWLSFYFSYIFMNMNILQTLSIWQSLFQCQVSILHLYHPSSSSFYILVFWRQQSFDPIGSEKSSVLWTFFWSLSVPMLRLLSAPRPKLHSQYSTNYVEYDHVCPNTFLLYHTCLTKS